MSVEVLQDVDDEATDWSSAVDAGITGLIHLFDHKWRFVSRARPDSTDPWAVVEPDRGQMDAFFARVAARGVMFDPTMMAASRHFTADAFAAALHAAAASKSGDLEARRPAILADMLRTMHRHGVRWVAGTDAGESNLLEEPKIYEIVGIPTATILQTATARAASWLGRHDFGTVEPGKRADLILVDGDPLPGSATWPTSSSWSRAAGCCGSRIATNHRGFPKRVVDSVSLIVY